MNDLAERALDVLATARRALAARPAPWLAGLGGLAAAGIVVVGGRIGAAPAALPLTSWFGLLPHAGYRVTDVLPGLLMLGGIAVLTLLWLVVVRLAGRGRVAVRSVWTIGAVWAAPFVLGPPLMSTDAYVSIAHGLLAKHGLSPYHHGPASVPDERLVNAIDPTARGAHATTGPLTLALEHVLTTAAAGNVLGALLLMRALAVLSVVALGRVSLALAAERRPVVLAVTTLNPAVLLFVVSGNEPTAAFAALLLGAVHRSGQRRWSAALVLTGIAAALQPVGLIAVLAVLVRHGVGRPWPVRWRIAVRDTAIALATLAVLTLTVPFGLAWTAQLSSLTREHTPFAPASVVSDLISAVVTPASFDDLAAGGRIAAAVAAVIVTLYLLVTARERPLERTIGYALLAAGLLGPVLHPWFLLWGVLVLAPTATGALLDWVIALSLLACVLDPPGFATRTGEVVTVVGMVVIAGWLVPRLVVRHRRAAVSPGGPEVPAPVSGGE